MEQTTLSSGTLDQFAVGEGLLADYAVSGVLGKGGMGEVYLVRSRASGQVFAVKLNRFAVALARRRFLEELLIWIDLPEHPHVAACRFFRTFGEEVAIFAEYLAGGSLSEWIRSDKLSAPDRILDVAIQFARGLHAIHSLGLVHQDVKPANLLMTPDGLAKVADFGLARARHRAEAEAGDPGPLVSARGMTLAYRSPEQAARHRLTLQTDVWSWGVSLLEVFDGEVTWLDGLAAPRVLERLRVNQPDVGRPRPAMPDGVASILGKCFCKDPAQRWASMALVEEALKNVYRDLVGRDYPRAAPTPGLPRGWTADPHDRSHGRGHYWRRPRAWLGDVYREAGLDPADIETFPAAPVGSRKAQAVADLAAYEEARLRLERLVAEGRTDLEPAVGVLYLDAAAIHDSIDDRPGAGALQDRAIALFRRRMRPQGRPDLPPRQPEEDPDVAISLASAYSARAASLRDAGDLTQALDLLDQEIAIYERLMGAGGRPELESELANSCVGKAALLCDLGDLHGALALLDRGIAILERLVDCGGAPHLGQRLALAYSNKAIGVRALGNYHEASGLFTRSVQLLDRLATEAKENGRCSIPGYIPNPALSNGRPVRLPSEADLLAQMATSLVGEGLALGAVGDLLGAFQSQDRAVHLLSQLVAEGRRFLEPQWAEAFWHEGNTLRELDKPEMALAAYDRALSLLERLVLQEERRDLASTLARVYVDRGGALFRWHDLDAALKLLNQGIGMLEDLRAQPGSPPLTHDLAKVYANKGLLLCELGNPDEALAEFDRSIESYRSLVSGARRQELQGELAKTRVFHALVLHLLRRDGEARAELREALPVVRAEAERTGSADLHKTLVLARQLFGL